MEGVSDGSRMRQRSMAFRPASIKAWRKSSYPCRLVAPATRRLEHAKIHAMHEYDFVRLVEQPNLFHGGKGIIRPIHADYDSHCSLLFRIAGAG